VPGKDWIERSDLPQIKPFELPKMMDRMLNAINCYP
jgi:hypothetical protein